MSELKDLKPGSIWKNFERINAVPRPSKREARIIAFMMDFGRSLELPTERDEIGNVVIKKPGTSGMKDHKTVILQSHLDMVHQKNKSTDFDFDKQGIPMMIEGDFVCAKGTTLGADNGLGVATMMALLENEENIEHPPIEALFTIDEETGMTGAKHLDASRLSGELLINLDTEEDNEIGIGCAGGVDVTFSKSYQQEKIDAKLTSRTIKVSGLNGGHSGMDIHKGLGNANKLLNRILFSLNKTINVRLHTFEGGGLRNAIPREAEAVISFDSKDQDEFKNGMHRLEKQLLEEFSTIEENISIDHFEVATPQSALSVSDKHQLLATLYNIHHGVYRMSPSISGLVETSNNLAKVEVKNGKIELLCLTRSSVESGKQDLSNQMEAIGHLGNLKVIFSGDYPGWTPNPGSTLLKLTEKNYRAQNKDEPIVAACHAGLECGILSHHLPDVDMVSIGPTIRGAHSPDERAKIASVQKFWELLKAVLADIPKK
mgnify:CR=1 FL=1